MMELYLYLHHIWEHNKNQCSHFFYELLKMNIGLKHLKQNGKQKNQENGRGLWFIQFEREMIMGIKNKDKKQTPWWNNKYKNNKASDHVLQFRISIQEHWMIMFDIDINMRKKNIIWMIFAFTK